MAILLQFESQLSFQLLLVELPPPLPLPLPLPPPPDHQLEELSLPLLVPLDTPLTSFVALEVLDWLMLPVELHWEL